MMNARPQEVSCHHLVPPSHIILGPLTRYLLNKSKWEFVDQFPAWQGYADEVEQLLRHLEARGRFEFMYPRLHDMDVKHRDAALAEARVSFFLDRLGFRILKYDPPGANGNEGDLVVEWPGSPEIFVEIKAPSWRSEVVPDGAAKAKLTPTQWNAVKARLQQPKYEHLQGGSFNSATPILDVIARNGLKKLFDDRPNLIVILDDLFVSPIGFPTFESQAEKEVFSLPNGCRLGGILLFNVQLYGTIEYSIQYIANRSALPQCAIPEAVERGLVESTEYHRLERMGRRQWMR